VAGGDDERRTKMDQGNPIFGLRMPQAFRSCGDSEMYREHEHGQIFQKRCLKDDQELQNMEVRVSWSRTICDFDDSNGNLFKAVLCNVRDI